MELNEAANAIKNPASLFGHHVLLGSRPVAARRHFRRGSPRTGRGGSPCLNRGRAVDQRFAGIDDYLCEWSGTDQLLSAAFVGMSGHMGSRAISGLEKVWAKRMGFDVPADPPGQS